MKKILKPIASAAAICMFALWWIVGDYYRIHSPTVPDVQNGRIYEKNYHGKIVFLTFNETASLYIIPGIGFLIMIGVFAQAAREGKFPINASLNVFKKKE